MTITFDAIHTRKKQQLLTRMMEETAACVHALGNDTPPRETCPICNSSRLPFFVQAYGFDMVRCADCGLIFCNPYPSQKQLHHYYNSPMKAFENEFFRESFEHRVGIFLPRVDLIQRYRTGGRLLDIGSAIGIFLEALQRAEAPFEVSCCDLSTEACRELKERFPEITVINADILTLEDTAGYDVVTLWDTLEHIVDLDGLLRKIHRLCGDRGLFVFSTPNTDSFEWVIAGDRHVQILPPGHVNLMNRGCLERLLARNGFVVREAFTLNASLDISYVCKLIDKGEADMSRLGLFLRDALDDPDFKRMLADWLVAKRKAGNIVVVAEPVGVGESLLPMSAVSP